MMSCRIGLFQSPGYVVPVVSANGVHLLGEQLTQLGGEERRGDYHTTFRSLQYCIPEPISSSKLEMGRSEATL